MLCISNYSNMGGLKVFLNLITELLLLFACYSSSVDFFYFFHLYLTRKATLSLSIYFASVSPTSHNINIRVANISSRSKNAQLDLTTTEVSLQHIPWGASRIHESRLCQFINHKFVNPSNIDCSRHISVSHKCKSTMVAKRCLIICIETEIWGLKIKTKCGAKECASHFKPALPSSSLPATELLSG